MTQQRRRRSANAAIEFALLLPIVFTIFGSILDVSMYLTRAHVVQRASRDAARVGSTVLEGGTSHTGVGITNAANAQAIASLNAAGLPCGAGCSVTSQWALVSGTRVVAVTVLYPYVSLIGILPLLPATIRADFTMMTQQQT